MEKKLKIFTCSPRAFMGVGVEPHFFFCRDMGLQSLTLRKLGAESRVVLLKAENNQEHPDILRASMKEMESAAWWKQHKLDAVVLGSWARADLTPIAKAVSESGAKLVVRCDTGGSLTQRYDSFRDALRMNYFYLEPRVPNAAARGATALAQTALHAVPAYRDKKLYEHLKYADCVAIETPDGAENLGKLMAHYGHQENKVRYIPHLVSDDMRYVPAVGKQKQIVSVGRWDSYQKNTPFLIECLIQVLEKHADYEVHLFGTGQEVLSELLTGTSESILERIHLRGIVKQEVILEQFQTAQIYFMPSRYEGSSVAGQEALCCGLSVVGSSHVGCIRNFVSKQSGTLAGQYSVQVLTQALNNEIGYWQSGRRNASQISNEWTAECSASAVSNKILKEIGF